MGLFGGSSQSTSSIISSIDFSPIFQIGESLDSTQEKTLDQTASVTPKLDDSIGVSAAVGVLGGTGGSASTSRLQEEEIQPTGTATARASGASSINPLYLLGGAGVLVAVMLFKRKEKGLEMGFFSSIFGGGSSNAAATTTNTTTISPITNIDFDLEPLAEALEKGNELTATEQELLKVGLQMQQQTNILEAQKASISIFNDEKTKQQITLLILLGGSYYLIKNLKKGKK